MFANQRNFGLLLVAGCMITLPVRLLAQGGPEGTSPQIIHQEEPQFYIRAEVNHTTHSYREGDFLSVSVASEVDAYVYVFYRRSNGKILQIFPSAKQPNNQLKARQAVKIPADDDLIRWRIEPPFGKESIQVIASKRPLKNAIDPLLHKDQRFIPVSNEQLKGVELELGPETPTWTDDLIDLNTYPADWKNPDRAAKRFGVFFGVGECEFNLEYEKAHVDDTKKTSFANEGTMNLPTPHRCAKTLAALMRETGQLNDLRVYTNEDATRQKFEEAVDNWLPSVSKPGDTVFIFFAGHGISVPSENPELPDDGVLIPYDFIEAGIYNVLTEELKEKFRNNEKIDVSVYHAFSAANKFIEEAKANRNQRADLSDQAYDKLIRNRLCRQSGISGDAFAHWLQRLDGRQIVVIVDACHAGAFPHDGRLKGQADPFNFAGVQLNRLKDLGQKEYAALVACKPNQVSTTLTEDELSVMTRYLVESIQKARGPLTIEQAADHVIESEKSYFAQLNAIQKLAGQPAIEPNEPQLYKDYTKAPLLKP